jgi:hypothetical protein
MQSKRDGRKKEEEEAGHSTFDCSERGGNPVDYWPPTISIEEEQRKERRYSQTSINGGCSTNIDERRDKY